MKRFDRDRIRGAGLKNAAGVLNVDRVFPASRKLEFGLEMFGPVAADRNRIAPSEVPVIPITRVALAGTHVGGGNRYREIPILESCVWRRLSSFSGADSENK